MIWHGSINLLAAILGGGFLGYAHAFKWVGVVIGTLVSAYFVVLTYNSSHVLIEKTHFLYADKQIPDACNISTYQDVVRYHLGSYWYYATLVLIYVLCLSGLTGGLEELESLIMPVLKLRIVDDSIWATPYFISCIIMYLIVLPLLCLESFSALVAGSILSLVAFSFVFVAVVVKAAPLMKGATPRLAFLGLDGFLVLSTFCFAWSIQILIPIIYAELPQKDKNEKNMRNTVIFSLLSGFIFLTVLAVIGFIAFGDEIESNIIDNFVVTQPLIAVCRAVLIVGTLVNFSMVYYPIRHSAITMFCMAPEGEEISLGNRIMLAFIFVTLAIGLTLFAPFFSFVGLFSAVMIQFIVPGVLLITPIAWLHPLTRATRKRLRKEELRLLRDELLLKKRAQFERGEISEEEVLIESNNEDHGDLEKEEDAKILWSQVGLHPSLIWNAMEDEDYHLKIILKREKMRDITAFNWFRSISQFVMGAVVFVSAVLSQIKQTK